MELGRRRSVSPEPPVRRATRDGEAERYFCILQVLHLNILKIDWGVTHMIHVGNGRGLTARVTYETAEVRCWDTRLQV